MFEQCSIGFRRVNIVSSPVSRLLVFGEKYLGSQVVLHLLPRDGSDVALSGVVVDDLMRLPCVELLRERIKEEIYLNDRQEQA